MISVEDRVLAVNGDTMTDLDMGEVYREHEVSDAATICYQPLLLQLASESCTRTLKERIEGYEEKPELTYEVSIGVNVISAWAIERFVEPSAHLDMPDLLADD